MKKVVILGGGYGGLSAIHKLLEGEIPEKTQIVLIDRLPYQALKTEFYALAAGTTADVDIRVPFPDDDRLTVKYGEVTSVDLDNRLVHMQNDEPLAYDWLVIALGCTDNYHGIPGAEQHTCSIQTFAQTRQTYQNIANVKPYGQVTIVGGGLSGVEVAAELRESRKDLNIRILDRGASILSPFPQKLQEYVRSWFLEHDVELRSHVSVAKIEPGRVFNQDEPLDTDVIVWTAGIQPVPLVQKMKVPKDRQGRVLLNEYHQIPDYPQVFVVGDCASLPFSPSAQAAEAQGKQVGQVLQAIWAEETPKLGKIKLKGILGSLGKKHGFGVMGERTVMLGRVPRLLKSGVLWMSKFHFG